MREFQHPTKTCVLEAWMPPWCAKLVWGVTARGGVAHWKEVWESAFIEGRKTQYPSLCLCFPPARERQLHFIPHLPPCCSPPHSPGAVRPSGVRLKPEAKINPVQLSWLSQVFCHCNESWLIQVSIPSKLNRKHSWKQLKPLSKRQDSRRCSEGC